MARSGHMHRKALRTGWLIAAGLAGTACASGYAFLRPAPAARLTIKNEATGQSYDDCRKAFAEATSDTVLSFSEGVFPCGEEVSAAADWLVLRGAGLGHTFLEYGDAPSDPPKPLRLTAITPRKYLRVEELSFGGLTDLPGDDGRAEIVRAGVATERPALIGGPGASMSGSAVIVHSVLAGWTGLRPPGDHAPKPLAFQGNGRIALVESIAYDVEQEFERFPAPGSVVILTNGTEKLFATHDPASKSRPDPSPRANVACGNKANPLVACNIEGQSPEGDAAIIGAAKLLQGGAALSALEPGLREAGKGFVERFGRALGAGIRQPDVYWFDETSAQMVQDGAQATTDLLAVLVRPRTSAVVAQCSRSDQSGDQIAVALQTARNIDHLLGSSTTETACKEAVKTRLAGLLDACKLTWDWAKAVDSLIVVDGALHTGTENADACRKTLSNRVDDFDGRGSLADFYMQEVGRLVQIDTRVRGSPIPSLNALVKQLPWIHLRAGRTLPHANPATVMDHLLHAAEAVGSGDGRELVETTPPCSLTIAGVSTRANTVVTLGEMPPKPKVGQSPHTVVEIPVQMTQADLSGGNYEGSTDAALLAKCEQKTHVVFQLALRKYFVEELTRTTATKSGMERAEAETLLQLLQAESGDKLTLARQTMPTVPAAVARLADAIRGQPLDAAPLIAKTEDSPLLLRPPPDWSLKDFDLAADQLAKAPVATLDACELAMPDVPWHKEREGAAVRGGLTLDKSAVMIRCVPKDKAFELTVRPANEGDIGLKLIDGLMRSLSGHLGWPKPKTLPGGEAMQWPAKGGRGALLYKKARVGADVASVEVTLGSTWLK